MAYVTVVELRRDLLQVPAGGTNDTLLQEKLDAATSIIDGALGFAFEGYTTATTKIVYGGGGPVLKLPPHSQGSVTIITPEGGTAVSDATWTEQADGSVYLDAAHIPYPYPYSSYGQYAGWSSYRYTVTANWGYGTVPTAIKQVCRELAKNLWFGRDTRSDLNDSTIGGTGGGTSASSVTAFSSGLSNRQLAIIKLERAKWGAGVTIA